MTEVVNMKTSPEYLKESRWPLTQLVSEDTLDVLYEIPELARQNYTTVSFCSSSYFRSEEKQADRKSSAFHSLNGWFLPCTQLRLEQNEKQCLMQFNRK